MKNIIIIFLFFSCSWPFLPEENQITIDDCAQWVAINIKYATDNLVYKKKDYWQTFEETRNKMAGDCEDGCGLFMDMLHERNIKSFMYIVENKVLSHVIVYVPQNDTYYDITNFENKLKKYSSFREYGSNWTVKLSYDDYKELSEKYHEYKVGYGEVNEKYLEELYGD